MKITIRYFAAFREAAGIETETLDTSAESPEKLFGECASRHAGLQGYSTSMVAINDEMTGWDALLSDGDEVLFFPPVAGG
jgi:molybdopterin converting factor small subunit